MIKKQKPNNRERWLFFYGRNQNRYYFRVLALVPLIWAHNVFAQEATPVEDRKAPQVEEKKEKQRSFMRFLDQDKQAYMQTANTRYRSPEGAIVDLIGAVHIADAKYYDDLNVLFDEYDALLYELVGSPEQLKQKNPKKKRSAISMIQRWMSQGLKLEFQMEGVDYNKEHFVHADMTAREFKEEQKARNESMLKLLLSSMKDPALNEAASKIQPSLGDLLKALSSPNMNNQLKYLFAKQLSGAEEILDVWGKDTVLLEGRNKVAIKKIKEVVQEGKKKIGLFYGAAHMAGIDKELREKLGYQLIEQTWMNAWVIDKEDKEEE